VFLLSVGNAALVAVRNFFLWGTVARPILMEGVAQMLILNPVKSKLVSAVPLGNLVLFSTHNSWWAGLRVSPGSVPNVHHAALILFGFRDEERRFPLLYWPDVGDQGCLDLDARPIFAADADALLTTQAPQLTGAGLSCSESGWTLTAQVDRSGSDLRAWDLETGLLTETPGVTQQISGWVLGVAGTDGKFVALARGTTSAGLG
jgi:hypothetical protein